MITYLQAVSVIENFATQNEMVQKFGFEFKEQMPNIATEDERYPLLFVVPIGAMPSTNTNEFEIDIYCLDRYTQDRVNVPSVVSDTQLILAMLTKWLEEGQTDLDVIHSYPMQPINNDLLDYCGGWSMRVRVEVDMVSICEIPLSGVEPTPPTPCADATQVIEDSLGNELYSNSIPSGDTETQVIQDSTAVLKDTLGTVISTTPILAEGSEDIVAPDSTYLVEYVNGTDIQSGSIVSGGSVVVTVPNPIVCADATVELNGVLFDTVASGDTLDIEVRQEQGSTQVGSKQGQYWRIDDSPVNINGGLIANVPAEDTLSINVTLNGSNSGTWNSGTQTWEVVSACADTTIEVNGTTEGTFPSGSTVDIQLSDSGGVVTPDSVTVVGNDVQIVLPDCVGASVGATLMKTGQTTSYRTGDDGDLEAGRDVSFFVLASNNPFGNTNRFTDELGGSTYTNNIVIDWSTYNGTNVLGISRLSIDTGNTWNQAVDNSLSYSIGTFTSGWRLPNIKEIFNLMNFANDQNNILNYSPLNLSSVGRVYWSSNTVLNATTQAYILNNIGLMNLATKTTSVAYTHFRVRTFTVTGTTLT